MAPPIPQGMKPGGRVEAWNPQTVRYVVADVDGTLVGSAMHATDGVAAAAQALRKHDVALGLATGRMRAATRPLRTQLEATGPHITFDGAAVDVDDHIIAAWPLAAKQAAELVSLVSDVDDAYLELYTADDYVVTTRDPRASGHWEMLGEPPAAVVDTSSDLASSTWLKGTIVVFNDAVEVHGHLVDAVAERGLRAGPSTSPRTPELAYINVTDPAADKGRALERAAAHLDIPLSAVLAIGDAPNDLPMLERAGTAIAMGQARPAIRAAAHLVVADVTRDGAAVALASAVKGFGQDEPGTL